ncbi:hypothetical protein BCV70DRAFT_202608 [Testicularia cyperi]|uniref:Uncharacterized protein n=1 Tax=Testicularia cyperi TaxID=1882483 RepID=A0A317XJG7_9BASI|nr:hypothetical protein BCV70DRAFT_202608 [Testicularia cyperi]
MIEEDQTESGSGADWLTRVGRQIVVTRGGDLQIGECARMWWEESKKEKWRAERC